MRILLLLLTLISALYSQYQTTDVVKDFEIVSTNVDEDGEIIYFEDTISDYIGEGKVVILNWFNPY